MGMMRCRYSIITVVFAFLAGNASAAIYSPQAVLTNTAGNYGPDWQVENAFNGSGLTPGFESGVTSFDSFLAGDPQHNTAAYQNEWFSAANSGYVDLDMGSILELTSLAIWNEEGDNGVGSLSVFASADASFSVLTELGTFSPAANPSGYGFYSYGGEILDFIDVSARYIRLEFVSASDGVFGVGEIAFRASEVPVPPAVWLFGSALTALIVRRRRLH